MGLFYNLAMNRNLVFALLFSFVAAVPARSADKHKGWSEEMRSAVDDDGVVRRGVFRGKEYHISVDACAELSKKLKNKDVLVEGRVTQVCQTKGCWLVMTGDESGALIRVRFKGYKYFVPKDIAGRRARVEGTLKVKRLSRRAAQHYEDDAAKAGGRKPRKIKKGRTELTLMADAIEVLPKAPAPADDDPS
jgi:hypothetical protein